MSYRITPQENPSLLEALKTEHLRTLSAPLDAYWEEALIGYADHYEIQIEGTQAGFFCLNRDHRLVAFHLSERYTPQSEPIFVDLLQRHQIKEALAGTNDSAFLSLCLDAGTHFRPHTLLFHDHQESEISLPEKRQWTFLQATDEDFSEILHHYIASNGAEAMDTESIETGFEDLKGYIRAVMQNHRIFVLREEGQLIATSECRISRTQKPYADLGMIVAEAHRRRGVGSYILASTKAFCRSRDLISICSCETGNVGSQKAIAKAGFVSRHRIVLARFSG